MGCLVLGYDGSPSAKRALDVAVEQARDFGAILGSIPHKLLHLSRIPVLCVPEAPK